MSPPRRWPGRTFDGGAEAGLALRLGCAALRLVAGRRVSGVPPALGTFGDRVRTLRLDLGLTRAQLAARINATPGTLYSWEIGRSRPLLKSVAVKRLADALQTTVDWLTTGREP